MLEIYIYYYQIDCLDSSPESEFHIEWSSIFYKFDLTRWFTIHTLITNAFNFFAKWSFRIQENASNNNCEKEVINNLRLKMVSFFNIMAVALF